MLIDICKSMYQDIAECFGYSVTEKEFYAIHGSEMDIMREIRHDVEQFSNKYQNGAPYDRAIIKMASRLAQPPGVVIKNCGCDYIREASEWIERDHEKKLIEAVNVYVQEHRAEYAEWLKFATEKSNMPMIGQICQDYLAGAMTYGCKMDAYPQLRDEECWLMDACAAGDGWAAFTQACLCYFGAIRWKVAVECYDKTRELLKIGTANDEGE